MLWRIAASFYSPYREITWMSLQEHEKCMCTFMLGEKAAAAH